VPESPPAAAAATQAAAPDTRPLTAAQWRSTSLPPQITVEDATAPAIATVSSSSSSLLLSADDIVEPTDDNPYGARKLRRGSDSLLSSAAGKRHGRAKSDGMIVAAALPGGARADENSEQVELSATTAELFEDSSMPPDSSSSSSGSHVAAAAAATTTSAAAASPAPASPTAPAATCSRLLKNFVSNRTAKQRAKVHGFRKLFHLPESEELLVDWQASIVKNGLCFAGRMYVGTTVITFASNIFGIKTRECIPACDVLSVMRSGAQFGVGGVIQLTTGSGGKYRFVLMGIAGIAGDLGILRSVVAGDIDGALRLVIGGEGAPDAAEETIADDVHEHEQSLVLAQSIADADADARYLSASARAAAAAAAARRGGGACQRDPAALRWRQRGALLRHAVWRRLADLCRLSAGAR
jgi:hypothetical protein